MGKKNIALLPIPKNVKYGEGEYIINKKGYISIDSKSLFNVAVLAKESISENINVIIGESNNLPILRFLKNNEIEEQAYILKVELEGMVIEYNSEQGAFYAVMTLIQLINCSDSIPCIKVFDYPDFKTRGYMLDISRNKVPTLNSLLKIVDMIASFKINQLQLYIEGFSFAYQSFENVWSDLTPLTGEELIRLDEYCKERYIDLVPNQNNFGHMESWLVRDEYKHLAECPNGFHFGEHFFQYPRCLNPLDDGSIELVNKMTDDLLPYFSSKYYNVCCDETWDLGQGKCKDIAEKVGSGKLYFDYLLKIYALVKSKGKTMMFWGDIIKQHPDLVRELPKDVIALEWGYDEEHPSEDDCKLFQKAGIPYYVCPGTASWNSMLGRTSQMLKNISLAAKNGFKYGAIGLLNTDWGDEGHWQSISVSYAGIAYGAAMSWGVEDNEDIDLAECLNVHVFKDTSKVMGNYVLDIGNYYKKEVKAAVNATHAVHILYNPLERHAVADGINSIDFDNVINFLDDCNLRLNKSNMCCSEADLIYNEFEFGTRLIKHGLNIGKYHVALRENEDASSILKNLIGELPVLIKDFQLVWLQRNKIGGMDKSLGALRRYQEEYKNANYKK